METIIHIGQHKTGTTSIQNFLNKNERDLASQGFHTPNSLVGYDNPSHFILNVYSLEKDRYSSMKEKLQKEKPSSFFDNLEGNLRKDISKQYQLAKQNNCNNVIWSNEGLYLLNSDAEYRKLLNLFLPHSSKITCICCFREVKSYRKSYSKQLLKQGISQNEVKDSYRYLAPDSWLFDYQKKIHILEQVFDQVITFSYNEDDNVSEFLRHIGYKGNVTESIRLNTSESS